VRVALFLVGFGHVGRRFAELLDESRDALRALHIDPVIVGVATRHHGSGFDVAGLDWKRIGSAPTAAGAGGTPLSFLVDALNRLRSEAYEARVVVETTTLDVRSGEPAISHCRAGLTAGAHVITANKGPVAFAYRALADAATANGCSFLFEGAVMDGIPIFNLVRESLPATTINGFRGVVNSTTNVLLSAMERGEPFDPVLKRMQEAGVAEADPSLDVDGWDAAAKGAALANVLLDAETTPLQVQREGISAATGARAIAALRRGKRLKLVVTGQGRGSASAVRVALEELHADDPLAILDEQANALEIDTWPAGRIVITQRDGGLEKTAYALVADLVAAVRP
jgi:homoserine dehydrogenase